MTSGERSTAAVLPTLGDVPLAHALVTLRTKQASGVFELRASVQNLAWIVLARGHVVSCSTVPPRARFGTVVYDLGLLDAKTLDAATVEATSSKRPLVDILVERAAISPAQRDAVLVEQVQRRLDHIFTMPASTTFTFREGRPSTTELGVDVDPLAAVWRGLCSATPRARVAEVLARVGTYALRLVSAPLAAVGATPAELALCDVLAQTPMTVRQLRSASKLSPAHVDRLVYFLVITQSVEVEGGGGATMPSREMWATAAPAARLDASSGPGSKRAPTSSRLAPHAAPPRGPLDFGVEEVRRRALGLTTESPFETLGLAEGASSEAARAAYFRLSKLWNPAHLPSSMEEVREEVTTIYRHMTRAHTLLTDPAARPAVVSPTQP